MAVSQLRQPDVQHARQYYDQLVLRLGCPVEVRLDAGDNRGKGIFATQAIKVGDEMFRERPLAGCQDEENKLEVPSCSHCFRPLGSIEALIGSKLCRIISELSEASEQHDMVEVQRRVDKIEAAVDSNYLQGLLNGKIRLPHSNELELPSPVPCPGGCGEEFCSETCAKNAWDRYHCLLCPKGDVPAGWEGSAREVGGDDGQHASSSGRAQGKAPAVGTNQLTSTAMRGSSNSSSGQASSSGSSSSIKKHGSKGRHKHASPARVQVHGVSVWRDKLAEFYQHANETNEIFRVAAQVVAITLVEADRLLQLQDRQPMQPGSTQLGEVATAASLQQQQQQQEAALKQAFLPFAVGHKAAWWEVVTLDEDDDEQCSEEELRAQVREATADSLALLCAALRVPAYAAPLLTLETYGSLVGMFELNNLGLNIPSALEAYFTAVADSSASAQAVVAPLMDALGADYDTPCEGTGFFALQSCANHSCAPCAAANGDITGETVVVALRDIAAGEEVTISYIDEEDMDLQQRRAALKDYGFVCNCARCQAESLAQEVAGL